MHHVLAVLALVPALDGESGPASDSTGVAVIVAISIVSGYVLLAALWWFVFRDPEKRRRSRRRRGRSE
jgi:hypothetical protein